MSLRSAIERANRSPGLDEVLLDIRLSFFDPTPVFRLTDGPIEITDPVVIRTDVFANQRLIIVADPEGDDIPLDTDALPDVSPFAGLQFATDLDASNAAGTLDDNHRIFDIAAGAETSISDLTLVGGVTMADGEAGGAIRSRSDLTLEDVEILSSATFGDDAPGGGVAVIEGASLRVTDGLVAGNATFGEDSDGGGVYQQSIGRPPMTDGAAILETRISGNRTEGALSAGGGLSVRDSLFLISSTVDGNATIGDGASGGGVNAIGGSYRDGEQGSVFVLQSTIADNFTSGAVSDGGGLRSLAPLQLLQSTVTGNSVSGDGSFGGGLSVEDMRIAGSLVLGNFSPRFESEEAFSTNPRSFDDEVFRFGELFLEGFNIIGADDGTFPIDVNRNAHGVTNYLGAFGFGAENADPDSVFAATAEVMLAEPGTTNRTIATGIHAGVLSDSGGALPAVSLSDDVTENPAVDKYRDLGIVLREDDEDLNSNFLTGEILPFRPGLLGLDLSTDNGLSVFGGVADLESDGRGRIDVIEVVPMGAYTRQLNRLDDVYFDRLVGHVAARLDLGAVELAVPERAEGVLPGLDLAGLDRALGLPEGTRAALDAGDPSMIGLSSEPIAGFDTGLNKGDERIDRDFLVLTTGDVADLFDPDGGQREGRDRGAPGAADDTVTLTLEIPRMVSDDALTFGFAFLTDEVAGLPGDFLSIRVDGIEAAIDNADARFANETFGLFSADLAFRRAEGDDTGTFLDNRSSILDVRVPLANIPFTELNDPDPVEVEITLADVADGVGDSAVLIGDFELVKAQNVWLNFDGGTIRFVEGGNTGRITLPASFTASDRIGLRDNIAEFVRNDYDGYDIGISLFEPSEPYTEILIGGRSSDVPAAIRPNARGQADQIDFENKDLDDVAYVLAQQVFDNKDNATWRDVAQLVSHELGHLLGLRHVTDDHDILYPAGSPQRRDIGVAFQGEFRRNEDGDLSGGFDTNGLEVDYDRLLAENLGRDDRAVARIPGRTDSVVSNHDIVAVILEFSLGGTSGLASGMGMAPLAEGDPIALYDARAITFIPDAETFEGTVVIEALELGDILPGQTVRVPTRSEAYDLVAMFASSTPGGPVDLVVAEGGVTSVPADFVGGRGQIDGIGIERAALGDGPLTVAEVAADGTLTPVETLTAGTVEATVEGATEGPDSLEGTAEADTVLGLGGDDTLSGLGGDDLLLGNDGADRIAGGPGLDTVNGGPGADAFADDVAGLDGDLLEDFSTEDRILLTDIVIGDDALIVDPVAGTLGIDTDGDGAPEASIRLRADPRDFIFSTAEEAGDTAITAIAAPPPPEIAITPVAATIAEEDAGFTEFGFQVVRSVDTTGTLTLDWFVTGAGADAADFGGALPSGTVTFADGEATRPIAIPVAGDTLIEPGEGFTVTLTEPEGRVLVTTPSARGTILNDDTRAPDTEPPLARADIAGTEAGVAVSIPVLANDGDPGGGEVSLWAIGTAPDLGGSPSGGIAVADGDSILYTPDPGFEGVDSFSYEARDAEGNATPARVTVVVGDLPEPAPQEGIIRGTTRDDVISVAQNAIYLGVGGSDTFLASRATGPGTSVIDIDPDTASRVQITDGLEIVGSLVLENAVQLDLASGGRVQILNADSAVFDIAANATTGDTGVPLDYASFARDVLNRPIEPSGFVEGPPVIVDDDFL